MRSSIPVLLQLFQAMASRLPSRLCPPLRAAHDELCRNLHLAFRLAAAHRQVVMLEPYRKACKGRLSVRLPEGVHWGRPATVPLPPELDGTGWQDGRPRAIAITPQRQAMANVWFVHHGQEALCLRLGISGSVELLRYRPLLGAWTAC